MSGRTIEIEERIRRRGLRKARANESANQVRTERARELIEQKHKPAQLDGHLIRPCSYCGTIYKARHYFEQHCPP